MRVVWMREEKPIVARERVRVTESVYELVTFRLALSPRERSDGVIALGVFVCLGFVVLGSLERNQTRNRDGPNSQGSSSTAAVEDTRTEAKRKSHMLPPRAYRQRAHALDWCRGTVATRGGNL
jgi:hypothetical protein